MQKLLTYLIFTVISTNTSFAAVIGPCYIKGTLKSFDENKLAYSTEDKLYEVDRSLISIYNCPNLDACVDTKIHFSISEEDFGEINFVKSIIEGKSYGELYLNYYELSEGTQSVIDMLNKQGDAIRPENIIEANDGNLLINFRELFEYNLEILNTLKNHIKKITLVKPYPSDLSTFIRTMPWVEHLSVKVRT